MQRHIITLAVVVFASYVALSQNVAVNTSGATANTSALLDVDDGAANNVGMLIPRISLSDVATQAPIGGTAPASLIVYNTNASVTNGNGAGYYYWSGSKWLFVAAPSNGPGTSGQVLASQGSGNPPQWQSVTASGCTPQIQIFTASGTWTWTTGVNMVWVSMVGGGGGGGGSSFSDGGGGGGGGQSVIRYPVAVSGNVSVTVGALGTGAAPSAYGNDGGATSFGSLSVGGGKGGGGAGGSPIGGNNGSGTAGSSSSADAFGSTGGNGGSGYISVGPINATAADNAGRFSGGGLGGGGASSFGGGGTNGVAGNGKGSGGGGAAVGNSSGGNGTAGYVIVEWFQ